MKVMKAASKKFYSIAGTPKADSNIKYRKSEFTFDMKVSIGYLCYNTLTKELILLDFEEYYDLVNGIESLTKELKEKLINKYYLLPENFNELNFNNQIENVAKLITNNNYVTNFNILTTTDCNARCFYCYEAEIDKYNMSVKTAVDVANYILKVSGNLPVKIRWFGGEPLFNYEVIDTICNKLIESGKEFSSSMISNAYLFDSVLVEKAHTFWNLNKIQITLDGTEEIYNRCKNYINSEEESPYIRVLNNIKLLASKNINIRIRINVDRHNMADAYLLVDELSNLFATNEFIKIYPSLLFENAGYNKKTRSQLERDIMTEKLIKLIDYIADKGMLSSSTYIADMKLNACMADSNNHITITPNGDLAKCEHVIDRDFIGNIYSSNLNKDIIAKWKITRAVQKECSKCSYYPMCKVCTYCPDCGNIQCDAAKQKLNLTKLKYTILSLYKKIDRGNNS